MQRRADVMRWTLALVVAAVTATLWRAVWWPADPGSTPIRLVDSTAFVSASPADLAPSSETLPSSSSSSQAARSARLAFTGDIMQHHAQASDDFIASYATIARTLASFDAVVGNLEFPVDSTRPVGPARGSTTFNGSGAHVAALARAGFSVLSVANNHAFDQGPDGFGRTIMAVRGRGVQPLGVAAPAGGAQPVLLRLNGITVALLGYTIPPNAFTGPGDTVRAVPRTAPLAMLNFRGWDAEFRDDGRAVLARHAADARATGADVLVAVVHWGEEWHLQPSADQVAAAHDIIDAGFDVVVGSHPHVLQGSEVYRGRVIAYSLGNFNSDFSLLPTRTGAILAIDVTSDSGRTRVSRFGYLPVTVHRRGHVVVPADSGSEEWSLACRILGAGVRGCR